MPSAILRATLASRSNVDAEKGIVYGCHLAEVGKLAVFANADGNPIEVVVTPALVESLLALCKEEERLNAHWTHSWADSKQDALLSRVATWRNFRKDDDGNLIADAFTAPGDYREAILHWAENDPKGMMVSMIFGYTGGRDNPIAHFVRSADFVAKGAATTALCCAVLSAISLNQTQTAKMADPVVDPNAPPVAAPAPAAPFTPEQIAAIQQIVQAAMNPPQVDDSSAPAMFAAIRKEVAARFGESETKIATLAQAAVVRQIGGTAVIANLTKLGESTPDGVTQFKAAVTAQLSAGAPNRGEAIRRVLHDKPELAKFREG